MSTTPQQPSYIIPPPEGPNWKTPLIIGAFLLLVAFNVYLYMQMEHLRNDTKAEMAKLGSDLSATVEQIRIDSNASVRQATKRVQGVQEQLEEERRAANRAVGQAKIDAQRKVDQLQKQVQTEQVRQQQAIEQVKQTADTASTKLDSVSTDVGTVKTDLGTTKSQLEQTIANLKRVTGDVDSHASLIATNGKELNALRALGEKNYFEFTIPKSKKPQRVGDITVQLKKADVKHNRYTIEVMADDKKVEKKDKTIDEPVQFYTSKSHQPSEIVVNQVRKNEIVGYLATPKVQNAAR
jgi:chromosome segregation ATPase